MTRIPEASSEAVTVGAGTAVTRPRAGLAGDAGGRRSVARAAVLSGRRWRAGARCMGLAIFLVGAALLGYVFLEALRGFQQFARPDYLAQLIPYAKDQDWQKTAITAVTAVASELLRVLYLLLLGYLASVIAGKGIQFFAASDSVIDEAVASGLDGDMDIDAVG